MYTCKVILYLFVTSTLLHISDAESDSYGSHFANRYLGASYDVPSLVEKLLHQLASKETIVVNVYDITDASAPINMYGTDVIDTGLLHISHLDFGDPLRKHEMHCRLDITRSQVNISGKEHGIASFFFA